MQVAIPFLLPLCMGTEPYFGGDTEVGHPVAVRRREAKRALQQEMMQVRSQADVACSGADRWSCCVPPVWKHCGRDAASFKLA